MLIRINDKHQEVFIETAIKLVGMNETRFDNPNIFMRLLYKRLTNLVSSKGQCENVQKIFQVRINETRLDGPNISQDFCTNVQH